jgi:hypothetical protein
MFVLIRLWSSLISSGFHLSFFHALPIPLPMLPVSELSLLFVSNIHCSSSRIVQQPLSMSSKHLFSSWLDTGFRKAPSACWRTVESVQKWPCWRNQGCRPREPAQDQLPIAGHESKSSFASYCKIFFKAQNVLYTVLFLCRWLSKFFEVTKSSALR